MRKTVPMSSARNYVGKAARPVFLTRRPRFVTRPDWSGWLALAGLGAAGVILGAAAFLLACMVLL
jgi:hypothetical protein